MPEEYPANGTKEEGQNSVIEERIDPRWEVLGTMTFDEKEDNLET
tara:strand:- start:584 stop:718 length:135 start_codon:yes stop_codon:yes gene_type:complete